MKRVKFKDTNQIAYFDDSIDSRLYLSPYKLSELWKTFTESEIPSPRGDIEELRKIINNIKLYIEFGRIGFLIEGKLTVIEINNGTGLRFINNPEVNRSFAIEKDNQLF